MLTSRLPLIQLTSCPKGYQQDLDKVVPPEDTIFKVKQRLKDLDLDLLSSIQRIDQGRLGIPVYLSVCGSAAKNVMPTRKQMGKGSSPKQAEASAIMELVERYSFFTYLQENKHLCSLTFAEASARFGEDKVLPLEEMLRSVQEDLELNKARSLLENVRFTFAP
ncbi:MAG: YcaO-like family protein, partial [Desulfovibrio sp.]|nr:YcaO-like family protein [Desulfovibrio sp.]